MDEIPMPHSQQDADPEGRKPLAEYPGPHCRHGWPQMLWAKPGQTGHDCQYEDARAALIPEAVRILRSKGVRPDETYASAFSELMDQLARERLFRKGD